MTKQKALDCKDCKHWCIDNTPPCANGHKPRYYQRGETFKRVCDDFEMAQPQHWCDFFMRIFGFRRVNK